ncbi:RCN11-like protein [Mya arenaria]|uniref:EGF domain-specific O-linked N-acetylglucosamine transferase n=1 Tax=Mya arenaria TaxID=6604 RepID=A0ABY7DRY4_MYAAR|nr:uncharacterized protein LOC128228629 [Mya arenaria]WAQ99366.1 RCN11-like protein [Mya arenaria]
MSYLGIGRAEIKRKCWKLLLALICSLSFTYIAYNTTTVEQPQTSNLLPTRHVYEYGSESAGACNRNIIFYEQEFVVLKYAIHIKKDVFSITCKDTPPQYAFKYQWDNTKPLQEWLQKLQTATSVFQTGAIYPVNDIPTFVFKRIEAHNLYHTMCEWMNVFYISKRLQLSPSNVDILFIDERPGNMLDPVWSTLFRTVTKADNEQELPVFGTLIWSMIGYISPLNNHALNDVPYLQEFRDFFLDSFRLKTKTKLNCKQLQITVILRRDYMTHPERQAIFGGRVHRKFKNEGDIVLTLKNNFPEANIAAIRLEDLTMLEQLSLITNTDILVGMHGAGLSHVLFLPDHALVIELFPLSFHSDTYIHFRTFARWRNLKYLCWQNTNQENEFEDFYTKIPKNIVDVLSTKANALLCGNM